MSKHEQRRRRHERERAAGLRKPLILNTALVALEQAARRLPAGVVLENLVGAAIAEEGLSRRDGDGWIVPLREHSVDAVVTRTTSPLTGRKAWRIVAVRAAT